jgi:hypothetical protein
MRLSRRSVAHATTLRCCSIRFYATVKRAVPQIPQACPSLPPLAAINRVMMCDASGSAVDRPCDVSFVTYRHTYFYTGSLRSECNGFLRCFVRLTFHKRPHWAQKLPAHAASQHVGATVNYGHIGWFLQSQLAFSCFITDKCHGHDDIHEVPRNLIPAKRPLTTP